MLKRAVLALSLAAAFAAAAPRADAASLSLARLKTILDELGYKAEESAGELAIEAVGQSNLFLHFRLLDDGDAVFLYSYWNVPADKVTWLPAQAMLRANSGAPFIFAVFDNDKDLAIDLEATLDASLINNRMLRQTIDRFVDMADTNEALVNTDRWSAPSGATTEPGPKPAAPAASGPAASGPAAR